MIDYPKQSRCVLKDVPDHIVYLCMLNDEYELSKLRPKIEHGVANIDFYTRTDQYFYNPSAHDYRLIPSKGDSMCYYGLKVSGVTPPPGASLHIDPRCHVPVSMLTRYNVVTSVGTDVPEYMVLPDEVVNNGSLIQQARLYKDKARKIIIALTKPFYIDSDNQLPQEWEAYLPSLRYSLNGRFPGIERFEPYGEGRLFDIVDVKSDAAYLYLADLLPKDKIVSETSLRVGSEDVTYDVLKSCMMMFYSSDTQLKTTAFYTLAQHDCSDYKELIRWMICRLSDNNFVSRLRQANKAADWLARVVQENKSLKHFYSCFSDPNSISVAKRVLADLSQNTVTWNHQGVTQVSNAIHNVPHSRLLKDLVQALPH